MPLLTISNAQVSYGNVIVLDGATVSVEAAEKVGLVGRNGSGKTTLMKLMLSRLEPDAGSVQLQRGARVGYLSQDPELDANDTVRDAAERAFAELHELHVQMHDVYDAMTDAQGPALEQLLKKQARLEAAVDAAGGYAIDHRVSAMLHGVGFSDSQFELQVHQLSGGQKGRLGLARLLLEAPDLLLLDEPTNHLDIEGRRWLETFLAEEYPGAVIVVSHDRWLLDRVVRRIIEVEQCVVLEYPGNYHKYLELRRERQLTIARQHDKQRDRIRQEEGFIARYKTGQRSKQARGRQSKLDRYKRDALVERPFELQVMPLKLPKGTRSGELVLSAEGISKRYDDLVLFDDLNLDVRRGDRIGIIGPNGVGKTTLIRCLLDDIEPDAGTVRKGTGLSCGYYRQLHEHLDMSLTIWQYLQTVIVALDGQARASEQQARDLAGAFLFSGDDQDKTLADVSGGERSRVVLAGLVASAHNLLVLDEPSNHLDIPSAERLEQALSSNGGYEGTLLLISHDRALLEATCDRLIVFDGRGGLRQFEGRYSDWVRREETEAAATANASDEEARRAKRARKPAAAPEPKPKPSVGGLGRLNLQELEKRIEQLERRRGEIDQQMSDPDVYRDGDRCRTLRQERDQIAHDLEPLEFEWSRRAGGDEG